MRVEQAIWTEATGWLPQGPSALAGGAALRGVACSEPAQLVLMFGATQVLLSGDHYRRIKEAFPNAHILGCSTAGEIYGTHVFDDSLVVTAVHFEHTQLKTAVSGIGDQRPASEGRAGADDRPDLRSESYHVGERLAMALDGPMLRHVLVISDGLAVNGSELVAGMVKHLPPTVAITGGLSGDGARFEQTLVCLDGQPEPGKIAALGFYGDRLKVGYGSLGGWDPFGPERLITRSKGNVLYELDGHSALDLYKKYLGDHAGDLPASGLLFPLSLRTRGQGSGARGQGLPESTDRPPLSLMPLTPDPWLGERGVVRTILGINEDEQSMTFAGDVPEGAYARLMKANFERLIDGATMAAKTSYEAIGSASPDLAILISCVGRKLVLKQRVEEEVEGVREILGDHTALTGFYSYGEISPFTPSARCELHNQTMTITTFSEE